jgi:hypothetical protein
MRMPSLGSGCHLPKQIGLVSGEEHRRSLYDS